eukprot:587438-Pleurochrysis_carterae.AAC.1
MHARIKRGAPRRHLVQTGARVLVLALACHGAQPERLPPISVLRLFLGLVSTLVVIASISIGNGLSTLDMSMQVVSQCGRTLRSSCGTFTSISSPSVTSIATAAAATAAARTVAAANAASAAGRGAPTRPLQLALLSLLLRLRLLPLVLSSLVRAACTPPHLEHAVSGALAKESADASTDARVETDPQT